MKAYNMEKLRRCRKQLQCLVLQDSHANGMTSSALSQHLSSLTSLKDALVQNLTAASGQSSQAEQPSDLRALQQKAVEPYLSNHEQLLHDSCEILKEVNFRDAPSS